jgi:hypothetical protein
MVYQIIYTFVCPILALFPFSLDLISAYIFSNIEFKTQTYRYLKLNSIIDALSILTILFLPLTECQDLCSGLWNSNYWLIIYRLYMNHYLTRLLRTISSILSVTIAWNRYKTMNQYKIYGNYFYFTLFLNCLFSSIIHLPNLFFNQVVLREQSTQQNETYVIKVVKIDQLNNLLITQFLFITIIFIFTVVINIKLALIIKSQINAKFKSIKSNKQMKKCRDSSYTSVSVQIKSNTSKINTYNIIFAKTKVKEFETSLLIFWISVVFIIHQVLQIVCGIALIFVDRDVEKNVLIFIVLYILIVTVHSFNFFIYYKFNRAFSRRIKLLYNNVCCFWS